MDKGYLLILIGAGLGALGSLGIFSFALGGYLLIAAGVHYLPTSTKELRTAMIFAFIALALNLRFFLLPRFVLSNPYINSFLSVLYLFFAVGAFFWILKAEYIWSPHSRKRMDLLMFSGVALIYLLISLVSLFPWISMRILPFNMMMPLFEVIRFVNILYHGVLIYILAKLYLEARQNGPGLKRWH